MPAWSYYNPLGSQRDVEGFVMEGPGTTSFPAGRLRLESTLGAEHGQAANMVLWCPVRFPPLFRLRWSFRVIREPGLAMMFFCADGATGEDLFSSSLRERDGRYDCYRYGDIETLHLSYFRRALADERRLHTVSLRHSPGFALLAQAADPIPSWRYGEDALYGLEIVVAAEGVSFSVDGLSVLSLCSPGPSAGARSGYIGLRQVAPLIAEYGPLSAEAV